MGFRPREPSRLHVLVYPSGVDVSSSALRFLTQQLRRHRRTIGSRWRRLSAGRQALLALAHLHSYLTKFGLVFGCFDLALTGDSDLPASWVFIEFTDLLSGCS
jgi:hypothetical protein